MLDYFNMCEIGSDFPIPHFWSHWIYLNPTFLKSLDYLNPTFLKLSDYLSLPHHTLTNEAFKAVLSFIAFAFVFSQVKPLFSWLIGIDFFSMAVINQPKKKPYTIVHCTVGKVGSKREAENKTAPLSIFCHLLPWDIIMHRQWRRKTIICQVLCTSTIHTYLQAMYNSTSNEFLFRNNGGVTYCHQEGCIVPWFCQPNLFCCLEMKYYKVASSRLSQ